MNTFLSIAVITLVVSVTSFAGSNSANDTHALADRQLTGREPDKFPSPSNNVHNAELQEWKTIAKKLSDKNEANFFKYGRHMSLGQLKYLSSLGSKWLPGSVAFYMAANAMAAAPSVEGTVKYKPTTTPIGLGVGKPAISNVGADTNDYSTYGAGAVK